MVEDTKQKIGELDGLMYNLVKEMSITEINRLFYTGAHVVDVPAWMVKGRRVLIQKDCAKESVA